ncbi:hypothetical protein U1Q18_017546, partial [Sarracenia purpurea var. burkii]
MVNLVFSNLIDDVVLSIFFKLEGNPQNWARLACVCTKFSSLIHNICWEIKCSRTIRSVVSDLLDLLHRHSSAVGMLFTSSPSVAPASSTLG